jgi:hypothetical protein
MRASGLHVNAGPGVLDIVGTGGDKCAPAQCGLHVPVLLVCRVPDSAWLECCAALAP